MSVVFIAISIPTTYYLLYLHELFSTTYYIYDDSSDITVQSLIKESGYSTKDFWFKNNTYEEKAVELLYETDYEYYNKVTYSEQVLATELLLEPLYDFSLKEEIIDKLSIKMQCLSKNQALSLLTNDTLAQSLGRICLTLSARPSYFETDEKLSSIDLLLIDNNVYALVTYNDGYNSISLYQLENSATELINDTNFTPYFNVLERENFKTFKVYLIEKLPSIALNNFSGILMEISVALFFATLGFIVCRITVKNKNE